MILAKINGIKYDFFIRIDANLTFDKASSTFSITCIVDPSNPKLKELYKPKRFQKVQLYIDTYSNLILTGYIVAYSNKATGQGRNVTVSGYSISGETNNLSIPKEAYPLQDTGKNLKQITEKILSKINIGLSISNLVAGKTLEAYEKAEAQPTDIIISYLSRLARQKNIVISNNEYGNLYYTDYDVNQKSAGSYSDEDYDVTEVGYDIDCQNMHSDVTVLNQANFFDEDKQEFRSKNNQIPIYRPFSAIQTDGNINDGNNLARNIIKSEQRNERYNITILSHTFRNGDVIKPNRIIEVKSESIELNSYTKMFVYDVNLLNEKGSGDIARLVLIPLSSVK